MKACRLLLIACLVLVSCEAERETFTLSRSGGFSGIEERYSIDERGLVTHAERLPGDTLRVLRTAAAPRQLVHDLFTFYDLHARELDTLQLLKTGNMTSAISWNDDKIEHTISWPELDPPMLKTTVLDSLYRILNEIESIGLVAEPHIYRN